MTFQCFQCGTDPVGKVDIKEKENLNNRMYVVSLVLYLDVFHPLATSLRLGLSYNIYLWHWLCGIYMKTVPGEILNGRCFSYAKLQAFSLIIFRPDKFWMHYQRDTTLTSRTRVLTLSRKQFDCWLPLLQQYKFQFSDINRGRVFFANTRDFLPLTRPFFLVWL